MSFEPRTTTPSQLASIAPATKPRFALATARPVAPSLNRSNSQYEAIAGVYDSSTPRIEALRVEAHRMLALKPGDTVVDVGCGTGKSLPQLSCAVGCDGRVVAIEPCRAMIEIAHARVREQALGNVELIEAQATALGEHLAARSADALLLMFTHDVLQSQHALDTLLAIAKPGARIALAGGKLFSGPLSILNPWVEWRQKPYCTTFENYDAPWRKLFAMGALESTRVHPKYQGIAYIAYGERK